MHILFFSDHFRPEPSAPAAHVYERAKLWVAAGHKVTVIGSAPNFPEGKIHEGYTNNWRTVESMDGIRVVRVKTFVAKNEGFLLRVLDYCSYAASSFLNALAEELPDVVISTSPHLFVPMAGVAYSMIRNRPHVFEIRDLWPATIAANTSLGGGVVYGWLEALEKALYRRSKRIVAFTPAFKRDLVRRNVPEDKIDVVVNGASLELFAKQDEKDAAVLEEYGLKNRFVVGYLGTIGLSHGLENVIRAAELLRSSNVTFFFVGVGAAKPALERAVAARKLENVVFAPRQLREHIPRYWSVCDVGLVHLKDNPVFASVIPSKIFEAMAVGAPILYVGPRGEGTALVEQYKAGIVVPPDDPIALADAAQQLAGDPQRVDVLAAASHQAAPEYSRERQAERTLASLRLAMDSP